MHYLLVTPDLERLFASPLASVELAVSVVGAFVVGRAIRRLLGIDGSGDDDDDNDMAV